MDTLDALGTIVMISPKYLSCSWLVQYFFYFFTGVTSKGLALKLKVLMNFMGLKNEPKSLVSRKFGLSEGRVCVCVCVCFTNIFCNFERKGLAPKESKLNTKIK